MKFSAINTYPFAAATVLQVFADQDYFLNKYRQAGARNIQLLEYRQIDGKSTITISRDVPVDVNIPAFARRFVPPQITIIQSDHWDHATRTGRIDIQFKGMPAEVCCAMNLQEEDGQTRLLLDFEVKIHVPLVGDKLALVLAEDLKKKFQADSAQAQKVMADIAARYC